MILIQKKKINKITHKSDKQNGLVKSPVLNKRSMDKISERITKAMKIRNMKQVDLARETGINKSAISSYLNDKYSPKQESIYLLSKSLKVSETWLMGLSDNMETEVHGMSDISDRISYLMKEKRMSYGMLSEKTGIYKSAIHRYATGETNKVPLDRIKKIASALETSPLYLIGLDNYDSVNTISEAENEIKDYIIEEPELWETYKKVYSSDTLRILLDGAKDLTPEDLKPILMLIRGIRKDKGLD